ncbi:aldose 1-epimerase [Thecamonas trahens ATCC 50062]|uniref:glucose-6-phosphate 1-epimerase n=1 Tax=Thecamonas trahens ATCC 50062 TaxID=461836 RepID=A0A0L0D796_THETB|nr:aldose 1-epimerase [Thecamonas trahens ATCC 50062]KNC47966.1 aldose 1-epimerase [Thecamonas trahens ATCC 50062]|eukprot:XP_013758983.1 aldose 1-epimerase [Thecamonas trahens ATCC 50062]
MAETGTGARREAGAGAGAGVGAGVVQRHSSGLEYLGLEHAATGALATVFLHGAHVTAWQPKGKDAESVLFTSEAAVYAHDAAIRGGIPVCFPQFAGQGPLGNHGFARKATWTVADASPSAVTLVLTHESDGVPPGTLPFSAEYCVELTDDNALRLAWAVTNGREENTYDQAVHEPLANALVFTDALHTYFAVPDAAQVRVSGLGGVVYVDKTDGMAIKTWPADSDISFAGEVDAAFRRAPLTLAITDAAGETLFDIERTAGFRDVVVWNPGAERAATMADLAPGDAARFICVEAANVEPVVVHPQDTHRAELTLRIGSW